MKSLSQRIKKQSQKGIHPNIFKNEEGAIDLASIMVGIIVIGLIGGVIASTVFAVIPWTQDNAAKQQLDSVVSAESAYMGLSSTAPPSLPAGARANSFGNSAELAAANLMGTGNNYCVTTPTDGKSYTAYSKSASGNVFQVTDKNSKPQPSTGPFPTDLPADCQFLTGSGSGPLPYVDPTPKTTSLTYKCDTTETGWIPARGALTGTETWSDGSTIISTTTYNNVATGTPRTLTAGVEYKVTFEGTYTKFDHFTTNLRKCLISLDHWGMETGVTSASSGFQGATKLVDVPEHLPPTVTNMYQMFYGTSVFNDPDVSKWDVSNVTDMYGVFGASLKFNQPLNDWDVSNATNMKVMFNSAHSFNQPLTKWNVSKVKDMEYMFYDARAFDRDISMWNVDAVTSFGNFATQSPIATKPAYRPTF